MNVAASSSSRMRLRAREAGRQCRLQSRTYFTRIPQENRKGEKKKQ